MLLLQVQAEGQEMELALQDGGSECGPVGPEHSGQSWQSQEPPGLLVPLHHFPALPEKLPETFSPADISPHLGDTTASG